MFNSQLLSAVTDLGIRGNAKIGDRFARRLGHQSPRLLSWTCTKQPHQRTYDAFFKNIKLHMPAMLCPTEIELGQPCISTLLLFKDRTVPVLDDVARDIIPAQLHPDPLASGENVGNSRGECAMVSSRGGSEDDDESGDSEDEGAGEETEGDKSGDGNGEASNEGDSGDSEDDHTRTLQTGTYSSPPMHRRTFPIHAPSTSYVRLGQTSGASLTRDEVRDFISTVVPPAPSISTPPTAQAAKEPTVLATSVHVHGRGFSLLSVDHDEDMDKEMQERNGGAGMEFEPTLNGDDNDDVASGGSGKREDDGIASPTSVAEADGRRDMDFEPEKNSHDDEVPSGVSGNRLDKPIASASGVAEVDGKYICGGELIMSP
ncbi:Hypothetical predicted protein [Olea europaea subsp. europaea]|uniref:Uncharacterized protein n=1 Tax=Olea europaea subsp. europaea TaxID=158383 RepID=A0A8S0QXP7_OLEEU|nr:Hypothetical predicted protein [Olea europaea subsp. europaea]